MSIDFDVSGFSAGIDRAVADYERLGARALDELADETVGSAQAKAPVDTGELRASIGVKAKGHDGKGPFVDVGSDSDHAIPQEFGTSDMSPHPFMRPAFAEAPGKFGKGL